MSPLAVQHYSDTEAASLFVDSARERFAWATNSLVPAIQFARRRSKIICAVVDAITVAMIDLGRLISVDKFEYDPMNKIGAAVVLYSQVAMRIVIADWLCR